MHYGSHMTEIFFSRLIAGL